MVQFVGSNKASEDRRILEGALKLFTEEMRRKLQRLLRNGHTFSMTDLSDEQLLQARKNLAEELRTLYKKEDREVEIAIKALAVWVRRTEMEKQAAME